MKQNILLILLFFGFIFASGYMSEAKAKEKIKLSNLTFVLYDNGCFDVKDGNTFILRCA